MLNVGLRITANIKKLALVKKIQHCFIKIIPGIKCSTLTLDETPLECGHD